MSEPVCFPITPGIDFYCVVGNPIAHSLSPTIHRAFAAQLGERMEYVRVELPPDGFTEALKAFVAQGGRGMNVTVPFKEQAFAACAERSPRARLARAANTIIVEPGGLCRADNTDGEGLVQDLKQNLGVRLEQRDVLLIGAGGAARGVIGPLFEAGIRHLTLLNRTAARATALAADFPDHAVTPGPLDLSPDHPCDVVINATAGGLDGQRPDIAPGWVGPDSLCYDMVYGAGAASFLDWARACGAARCADGLGMLVEQAAAAFRIWRGSAPETAPVLAQLRARMGDMAR